VPELSDAALVAALRQHMSVAVGRQVVAASNLANASTPGYKAREVDFSQTLDRQLSNPLTMTTTAPGHLSGQGDAAGSAPASVPTKEAEVANGRRDGNTVELTRELLTMTSAAGDFSRAQTALAAKFKLLRYAITEGR
jgi:flagellar basal-body rod protein FlgB